MSWYAKDLQATISAMVIPMLGQDSSLSCPTTTQRVLCPICGVYNPYRVSHTLSPGLCCRTLSASTTSIGTPGVKHKMWDTIRPQGGKHRSRYLFLFDFRWRPRNPTQQRQGSLVLIAERAGGSKLFRGLLATIGLLGLEKNQAGLDLIGQLLLLAGGR